MAFRFTLAQVLRVRESLEQKEELALQRSELEIARVHRQIDDLSHEMARVVAAREAAMSETIAAFELQSMDAEINACIAAKQSLNKSLEELEQQRDAQRKQYQTAHNARQMLTDLETQQRTEYEQEQERTQQKRLDDLFAARIQRGQ